MASFGAEALAAKALNAGTQAEFEQALHDLSAAGDGSPRNRNHNQNHNHNTCQQRAYRPHACQPARISNLPNTTTNTTNANVKVEISDTQSSLNGFSQVGHLGLTASLLQGEMTEKSSSSLVEGLHGMMNDNHGSNNDSGGGWNDYDNSRHDTGNGSGNNHNANGNANGNGGGWNDYNNDRDTSNTANQHNTIKNEFTDDVDMHSNGDDMQEGLEGLESVEEREEASHNAIDQIMESAHNSPPGSRSRSRGKQSGSERSTGRFSHIGGTGGGGDGGMNNNSSSSSSGNNNAYSQFNNDGSNQGSRPDTAMRRLGGQLSGAGVVGNEIGGLFDQANESPGYGGGNNSQNNRGGNNNQNNRGGNNAGNRAGNNARNMKDGGAGGTTWFCCKPQCRHVNDIHPDNRSSISKTSSKASVRRRYIT
jgi:hypothetical protein